MLQLGVEENIALLPAESGALDPLIDEYVHRMSNQMKVRRTRTWAQVHGHTLIHPHSRHPHAHSTLSLTRKMGWCCESRGGGEGGSTVWM